MTKSKIWLSSPHIGTNELQYVNEAFATNWIAPLGPHVNAFERGLQVLTKSSNAAALSSGTSAIHLALILLEVKAGDTVFCQSITFSASANPIAYQGANPVFIDSESETWNMDPSLLKIALQDAKLNGNDELYFHSLWKYDPGTSSRICCSIWSFRRSTSSRYGNFPINSSGLCDRKPQRSIS